MAENRVAQTFGTLAAGFMEGFDEKSGEVPLACVMAVWSKRPGPLGGVGVRWHVARGQKALSEAQTLKLLDDLRDAVSDSGPSDEKE